MTPTPAAIGLWICERVIIESGTTNPSLISLFSGIAVRELPAASAPFSVFASLTDGQGRGRIGLQVEYLKNGNTIYQQEREIQMPSPLLVVNVHFRIRQIRFPGEGEYGVNLLVDDELLARRRLRVYTSGE